MFRRRINTQFLGRPIKPVAFGFFVAMLIIFPSAINDEGVLDGSLWGDFIGWSALGTAIVLFLAWLRRSQRLYEISLQLVFFLMIFRFVGATLVQHQPTQAGNLALAWAVIAGGSYLLEKSAREVPDDQAGS